MRGISLDKDVTREVGARLRAAREAAGLSQHELSAKSGVGRSTIAMLETGAQGILLWHISALGEALRVEPASLVPFAELARLAKRGEF